MAYRPFFLSPTFFDSGSSFFASTKSCGIAGKDLQIFDRWGAVIFQDSEPKAAWDGLYKGAACKNDGYNWKVKVTGISGNQESCRAT